MDYQTFMKSCKVKENGEQFTHTRIGDKTSNIYGGTYNIPNEKMEIFYKLYYDYVFVNGNKEYLTEKQQQKVMAIDLDFRYEHKINHKMHDKNLIDNIIGEYLTLIKKYVSIEPDIHFPVYVFEKPNVNQLEDGSLTKDGIHIIIGLQIDYKIQMEIRKEMILKAPEIFPDIMPFLNNYESIFDDGISKGSSNWQLIGSRKPNNEAYELTIKYDMVQDPHDGEFCWNEEDVTNYINENTIQEVSVRCDKYPKFEAIYSNIIISPETTPENTTNTTNNNTNYKLIEAFINKGLLKCHEHERWIKIGMHLKTIFKEEDAFKLWEKCTENYGTEHKKEEYKTHFYRLNPKTDNVKLALNTIKKIAKEENEDLFLEICESINNVKIVKHDKEATDIIYKKIKNKIKYSNNTIYLKKDNIWINDIEYINNYLLEIVKNSNLWKINGFGILIPYVQDYSYAKNVRILLINTIQLNEDIFFVNKLHTTTRGKICFIDGVLDFVNKKFIEWTSINFDYYSCIQIPIKFGEYILSPDFALIRKIKDDILFPLFDKDIDRALHFFSRAIAGFNGDKNYGTYNGNRNCGKGILYSLFESFYGYIKPFDLSNVLVGRNDNKSQEASRMMYWLMDYEFTRLSIAQETPKPEENMKINGRLFKKINSGGDTQTARRNYDRKDTNFIIDTTIFIAGNNELKYTENDVKEQEISFVGIKQFKTKEEIEQMKESGMSEIALKQFGIKDNNLKDIVKTEEYQKAFIYLIFSSFKDYAVPVIMKTDNDDEDENNVPLTQRILNDYIISKGDKVLVSDFIIQGFNKDKIEKALNNIGIEKKKWTKRDDFRLKWVYIGIRKKTQEEKECENEELDEEDEND
jgi:hypothetical protein